MPRKSVFPFGEEEQSSVKHLFTSFCNNQYLGQWEVANAVLSQLDGKQLENGYRTKDILSFIIQSSYKTSVGSDSIATPHHLSWLAWNKLRTINDNSIDLEQTQKDINFRLLLVEASSTLSGEIHKDLYHYHQNAISEKIPPSTAFLSSHSQQALVDLLQKNTTLGHEILQSLHAPKSFPFESNNTHLQAIYVTSLSKCLASASARNNADKNAAQFQTFFEILRLFNPRSSTQKLECSMRKILLDVVSLLPTHNGSGRDWGSMYGSLLGKESTWMLELFLEVCGTRGLARRGREEDEEEEGEGSEVVEWLRAFSSQDIDRELAWRDLYLICHKKQKHFLDLVMEVSLLLIQKGDFPTLSIILSPKEFECVRGLVLLVGWDRCQEVKAARSLLAAVGEITQFNEGVDRACYKLASQLRLVEWCQLKLRHLSPESCSRSFASLLHSLETRSALFMLRESTQLGDLTTEDVIDYLRDTPNIQAATSSKKTVRFSIDSSSSSDEPRPLHLEVERDLVIYHSFSATVGVIAALVASSESIHPSHHSSVGCSEEGSVSSQPANNSPTSSADASDYQTYYRENIVQRLEKVKEHVHQIFPLRFRLETLENLFSLLFVNSSAKEEKGVPSSGEEGATDAKSGILTPNMSGSMHEFNAMAPNTPNSEVDVSNPLKDGKMSVKEYRELKEVEGVEAQMKGSDTCHLSTNSTSSSRDSNKLGFLASDYLVRDVLIIIKQCLDEMNTTRFVLLGSHKVEVQHSFEMIDNAAVLETELGRRLKWSISVDEFSQRLSRLGQYVSESQWRLQLVADIPHGFGTLSTKKKLVPSSSEDDEEDSFEIVAAKRSSKSRRKKRRSSLVSDNSGSGQKIGEPQRPSQSNLESQRSVQKVGESSRSIQKLKESQWSGHKSGESMTDGATSTGSRRIQQQRRRKRKRSRQQRLAQLGIVGKMLASKESLLAMCLKKSMYEQAAQVVKMFHLEESIGATEAHFAKEFTNAVKQLGKQQNHPASSDKHRDQPGGGKRISMGLGAKPNLGALASIAAAGMSTVTVGAALDQLLGVSSLPTLHPEALSLSLQASPAFTQSLKPSLLPAYIVTDLACASPSTHKVATSLINVANQRLEIAPTMKTRKSESETEGDSSGVLIPGVIGFVEMLMQWRQLSQTEGMSEHLAKFYDQGLQKYLTQATLPLDTEELQKIAVCSCEMDKALRKAEGSFDEHRQLVQRHAELKDVEGGKPVIRIAIRNLIYTLQKHIPKEGLTRYLLRLEDSSESSPTINYLQSLYDHVKVLAGVAAKAEQTAEKNLGSLEYFRMLEEGPTQIMGRLIYTKETPPIKLESVAESLKVDLVQIIANNCCPKIDYKPLPPPPLNEPKRLGYKVVLNHSENKTDVDMNPAVLVQEILGEMVLLMKGVMVEEGTDHIFSLQSLVTNAQCLQLLDKSRLLAHCDMDKLNGDNERLCFYGNLYNLLALHAWFYRVQNEQQQQSDTDSMSPVLSRSLSRSLSIHPVPSISKQSSLTDSLIYDVSMAYRVGQLHIISLYDIREVLLRQSLGPSASYRGYSAAAYLSLDIKDPWSQYCPAHVPSTLLYCLCDGDLASPPLIVLEPQILQEQMDIAEKQYLESTLKVQENKVCIPELLLSHAHDFVPESCRENKAQTDVAFLQYLTEKTEGSTVQEEVRRVLQAREDEEGVVKRSPKRFGLKPLTPMFQPISPQSSLAYTFSYSIWKQLLAYESTNTESTIPTTMESCYNLTDVTLAYLCSKSDLVATLTSLISSKQNEKLEADIHEDHYPVITPVAEKSIVDFFKPNEKTYRYISLTKQFPYLHRYFLTDSLPLWKVLEPELNDADDPTWEVVNTHQDTVLNTALLTSPSSKQFKIILSRLIEKCSDTKQWTIAAKLFGSLASVVIEDFDIQVMRDLALVAGGVSCREKVEGESEEGSEEIENWKHLLQIADVNTRIRCILSCLHEYPVELCLQMLTPVLHSTALGDHLRHTVEEKITLLNIYKQAADFAREKASMLTSDAEAESGFPYHSLTSWQSVESLSTEEPATVLELMLDAHLHMEARKWAELHHMEEEFQQLIDQSELCYLLKKEEPDFSKAFMCLERVSLQPVHGLQLCEQLLSVLPAPEAQHFLADYLLEQLGQWLEDARREELVVLRLGCKAVGSLPSRVRGDYQHLTAKPLLLLEMLIMNMKIEWASQVLSCLHEPESPISKESTNSLVVTYATKALEFSVVTADSQGSGGMPRSQSRQSLLSMSFSPPQRGNSRGPQTNMSATAPTGGRTPSMMQRSGSVSIQRELSEPGTMRHGFSSIPAGMAAASEPNSIPPPPAPPPSNHASSSKFVMPKEPPLKEQWVPDATVTVCMVCTVEHFSMFNRRHHCRRCGRVVCADCSGKTTSIRGTSARTCDQCYEQMFKPKVSEDEQEKLQRLRDKLSGIGSTSPGGINISLGSPDAATLTSPGQEPPRPNITQDNDPMHQLTLDDDGYNASVREDFYYEHAPSTSLCLSVLELHSCVEQGARVLLQLCDHVSTLLQPLPDGTRNTEVDYGLVISMLKHLLFHAKVGFLQAGDNAGVGQCDQYSERVSLLDLLVANHCGYIPSILQLDKIDTLRRLRSRLVEEERLSLAMEVSTKCGLDTAGVWTAGGLACLQVGDYAGARDKLGRVLRAPADKMTGSGGKLLQDVIDTLKNAPPSGTDQGEQLLAQLQSVKDLLAEPQPKRAGLSNEDGIMGSPQMQECVYYLTTYGGYANILHFYRSQGCIMKAAQFVLDKKLSGDVFVEHLMSPCIASGECSKLLDLMHAIDPSLQIWAPYLTAACRHLTNTHSYHMLYHVQCFIKDYIRAGMTCVMHFYSQGAKTYLDLHRNMHYLHDAKAHLETYLGESQWTSRTHKTSSITMILTPVEVTKYIHAIDLQTEVTKFLYQYHDNFEIVQRTRSHRDETKSPASGSQSSASGSRSSASGSRSSGAKSRSLPLPTLFGSTKMKSDIACLILLCGNNVNDGYGLGFRIIQNMKLDANFIYTQVGREFGDGGRSASIRQLSGCVRDSGLYTDHSHDELVMAGLRALANNTQTRDSKDTDNLIKLLKLDENKVNGYIVCGKLKSAYLIAVKSGRVEDVKRIASTADRMGQTAVKSICDKWLVQRGE